MVVFTCFLVVSRVFFFSSHLNSTSVTTKVKSSSKSMTSAGNGVHCRPFRAKIHPKPLSQSETKRNKEKQSTQINNNNSNNNNNNNDNNAALLVVGEFHSALMPPLGKPIPGIQSLKESASDGEHHKRPVDPEIQGPVVPVVNPPVDPVVPNLRSLETLFLVPGSSRTGARVGLVRRTQQNQLLKISGSGPGFFECNTPCILRKHLLYPLLQRNQLRSGALYELPSLGTSRCPGSTLG